MPQNGHLPQLNTGKLFPKDAHLRIALDAQLLAGAREWDYLSQTSEKWGGFGVIAVWPETSAEGGGRPERHPCSTTAARLLFMFIPFWRTAAGPFPGMVEGAAEHA